MRILLATDSYKPNIDGAAVFAERLARKLVERNIDVAVVAPSPSLHSFSRDEDGVRVHYRAAWRPIKSRGMHVAVSPAVREVMRAFAPDVLHINLPYAIGFDALRAAKRLGIPVLATNHVVIEGTTQAVPFAGAVNDTVENAVRQYLLWFYRQCDLVTVPTQEAAAMLLGPSRRALPLAVVSNGVDLDLFQPRPLDERSFAEFGLPSKPIVLYAGRLEAEKSLDRWLRVAALVCREADVQFVVAGSGTQRRELEALAASLGVDTRVRFVGALSSAQLARLHNIAAVFLICSATESQSIATLEAAASGLPIVAANAGALPRLVVEGKNGFLAQPDDDRELAARVLRLLRDRALRASFAVESRRIASGHALDATVESYLALYRRLAAGAGKRAA